MARSSHQVVWFYYYRAATMSSALNPASQLKDGQFTWNNHIVRMNRGRGRLGRPEGALRRDPNGLKNVVKRNSFLI